LALSHAGSAMLYRLVKQPRRATFQRQADSLGQLRRLRLGMSLRLRLHRSLPR
jgi:hypothetical protein